MNNKTKNNLHFLSRNILSTTAVISLMGVAAFAVAPTGGYMPGSTLDPDCAPGDIDCIVQNIGTESDPLRKFVEGSGGLNAVYTGGRVGIGTNEPNKFRNIDLLGTYATIKGDYARINAEGTGWAEINLAGNDPSGDYSTIRDRDNRFSIITHNASGSLLRENLVIEKDTGNIGIRTSSPEGILDIEGYKAYVKIEGGMSDYGLPYCTADINLNIADGSNPPTEDLGTICTDRDLDHATSRYNKYQVADKYYSTIDYTNVLPSVPQCSWDADPANTDYSPIPTESQIGDECWDKRGSYYYHRKAVKVGDVKKLTIGSNGNITVNQGIAPYNEVKTDQALNVGGNISAQSYSPQLILQRNVNYGGFTQGVQTKLEDGTNNWFFGNLHQTQFVIAKGNYSGRLVTIKDTGEMGIGTSTPSEKLDVAGNIKSSGTICDTNGCIGSGGGKFVVGSGSTNAVYTGGLVGIGTDNPHTSIENTGRYFHGDWEESHEVLYPTYGGARPQIEIVKSATTDKDARLGITTRSPNRFASNSTAGDKSSLGMFSHGSARTLSRWGSPLAGGTELISWGNTSGDISPFFIGSFRNTDPLIFGTANTERLRITATGSIGINTNIPNAQLEVKGDAKFFNQENVDNFLQLGNDDNNKGFMHWMSASGSLRLQTVENNTYTGAILLQSNGGNVGIGELDSEPKKMLEVAGQVQHDMTAANAARGICYSALPSGNTNKSIIMVPLPDNTADLDEVCHTNINGAWHAGGVAKSSYTNQNCSDLENTWYGGGYTSYVTESYFETNNTLFPSCNATNAYVCCSTAFDN